MDKNILQYPLRDRQQGDQQRSVHYLSATDRQLFESLRLKDELAKKEAEITRIKKEAQEALNSVRSLSLIHI